MLLAAALAVTAATAAAGGTGGARVWGEVKGDPVYDVLAPDAIRAIDEPRFVSAEEGDRFMDDDELVIGIAAAGVAKAYSTVLLDHHEVVNDRLGDAPIAVTW